MAKFTKPVGKIVVTGDPIIEELKVENVSYMYPARFVKKGTGDDDVVVCAAATDLPVGLLGYEQAHASYKPATITTLYALNAWAPVLKGGKFLAVVKLTADSVVKGDLLILASQGRVRKAVVQSVAVPVGGTAVTSTAAQPDLTEAGSIPAGGQVVARAEETQDASGADKDLMATIFP